jgi:hypothetical protein
MNLDYIEVAKFIGKDKLNTAYLQRAAYFEGAEKYYFDRCRKIEVWHYEKRNQIALKGSLPYWLNGHNYYSSLTDWKEGLDYLQGCLNVNLYAGIVNCFEFGTIQEIPFLEAAFLRNHVKMKGMESRQYQKGNVITGKEFISACFKVKLYDAARNIKNKLEKPIKEELARLFGWDKGKHYIKLENHYMKPEAYFKGNIYLNELLSPIFQNQLMNELLSTYQSIMKTGNFHLPEKKGDINAGTLPLLILKELESIYTFRTEDLLKAKLKEIPEEILSPADRKARMKTIKDNLKKISNAGKSEYDITELLQERIQHCMGNGADRCTPFIWEEKGEEILSKYHESGT